MKMRFIAIAAIAVWPAVALGQATTHIRVSKDGSHSATQTTGGDVYTAPTPAPEPAPAPAAEPAPEPAPAPAPATDSTSQLGTGAPAPTPTHTMQADSTMNDSATAGVDTVRVPRNQLNVSPVDSVRMGIPSTRQLQAADSAQNAQRAADSARRSTDTTSATPPPR